MGRESIVLAFMIPLIVIIFIIASAYVDSPTDFIIRFEMDNNTLEAFRILERTNTTIVQIYQCDSNYLYENTSLEW